MVGSTVEVDCFLAGLRARMACRARCWQFFSSTVPRERPACRVSGNCAPRSDRHSAAARPPADPRTANGSAPASRWVSSRSKSSKKEGKNPAGDTLVTKFDRVATDEDIVHRQTAGTERRVKQGVIFALTSGAILAGINIGLGVAA